MRSGGQGRSGTSITREAPAPQKSMWVPFPQQKGLRQREPENNARENEGAAQQRDLEGLSSDEVSEEKDRNDDTVRIEVLRSRRRSSRSSLCREYGSTEGSACREGLDQTPATVPSKDDAIDEERRHQKDQREGIGLTLSLSERPDERSENEKPEISEGSRERRLRRGAMFIPNRRIASCMDFLIG